MPDDTFTLTELSHNALSAATERNWGSPFYTLAYIRARGDAGDEPLLLVSSRRAEADYCLAFFRRGRLSRSLEIPCFPNVAEPNALANAVESLARSTGADDVYVNSYGSRAPELPRMQNENARYSREELLLDLSVENPLGGVARNHRGSVRLAEKAGLRLVVRQSYEACLRHVQLMADATQRREQRGDRVTYLSDVGPIWALVKNGAGDLYQAVHGDVVVASMLLLRSPSIAYMHTSGTTSEGRAIGAAPFLITSAALDLKARVCEYFNLGGVRSTETGLREFKLRFGATPVQLEALQCRPHWSVRRPAQRVVRVASSIAGAARASIPSGWRRS